MARRRRRSVLRPVVAFLATLALLVVAVAVVVAALDRTTGDEPVAEGCHAHLDGTDWSLSPDQAQNAALIGLLPVRRGMPARASTIGIATALQESSLENIDYGDRDSVGLFQQRPSQGWGSVEQIMDPVYSATKFYDGLDKVAGYESLPLTVAAQTVQRSGFPDAYAKHETRSRAWASALTGWSHGTLTCTLAPLEGPASPDPLLARITRDLGDLPRTVVPPDAVDGTPTTVELDATPLTPGDPGRAAWAAGQWAVAVASTVDVDAVTVGGLTWSREDPTWHPSGTLELPAGQVRIAVGR